MSDTIINHDEAFQLAQMKQQESNLARCYLDLRAQLAAPDPTLLVKIRNVALEEAAQVCEDTDIVECPSHQAMYCQLGDASATRGVIAAAIRERILDAAPQGEGA